MPDSGQESIRTLHFAMATSSFLRSVRVLSVSLVRLLIRGGRLLSSSTIVCSGLKALLSDLPLGANMLIDPLRGPPARGTETALLSAGSAEDIILDGVEDGRTESDGPAPGLVPDGISAGDR